MIKYVFLDLDDTILDFGAAERAAISELLLKIGYEPTDALRKRYSEINDSVWKKLERGEATREEILTERFEIFLSEIGSSEPPMEARHFYEQTLSTKAYLIDGAIELLENLSKKYELYILSNGTARVARRRIALAKIESFFKGIFISSEFGEKKPSRAFFDLVFEKIEGFRKENAIIVGDSLSSDILGGKNAEIKTCLFDRGGIEITDIVPDYTVTALGELPKLLERI